MTRKLKISLSIGLVFIMLLNTVFPPEMNISGENIDEPQEEEVIEETIDDISEDADKETSKKDQDIKGDGNEGTPEESSVDSEETDEDVPEEESLENQEGSEEDSKEEIDPGEEENATAASRSGAADIGLLSNTQLNAAYDGERIILEYSGRGLLSLGVLTSTYSIFQLPPEIAEAADPDAMVARYDVPAVSIIIPIIRNRGTFDTTAMDGNSVYMDFYNLLSLNILSTQTFRFTLEIPLDELPPSESGVYTFHSQATSQLVDLSILSGEDVATATLEAPVKPESPMFDEPVYTTDDSISGTAPANTEVLLVINGEEYRAGTGTDGIFNISIPTQEAGTIITGTAISEEGYESEESVVTVFEAPDTEPPDTPVVEPVYSNHSEVTGTGEPDAEVKVTIGATEYTGTVDGEGNFIVNIPEQTADTVISITLTDETGNVSEPAEVTVISAILTLRSVPEMLAFEPITITSGEMTVPREGSASVTVEDTRGEGSPWRLLAEADPLTTADESHQLTNTLVHVDGEETLLLENGPVEVYSGETDDEAITNITWPADQGPLINVSPSEARAEKYSTTITWKLVDAP